MARTVTNQDVLVRQLRGRAQWNRDKGMVKDAGLHEEAAALIESQAAEIERLRAAVEGWR